MSLATGVSGRQESLGASRAERHRLASVLQSELGETLTELSTRSAQLAKLLPESSRHREAAVELYGILSAAGQSLNSLVEEVTSFELTKALHLLAQRAADTIPCQLECSANLPSLSPEVTQELVCIATEAVENALRHARATALLLRVQVERDVLKLEISDDGCGFAPDLVVEDSLGLGIMHFRAQAIGATLRVFTRVLNGTTIQCVLQNQP